MSPRRTALEAWLGALLGQHGVTGAALAVVRDGHVEVAAAGVEDVGTGKAVGRDTVFGAASLTKPLVSYAVLQLVDAGVMNLDEHVSSYVRSVVPGDARADLITVRHLLTHTCGLQNLSGKDALRMHFAPGAWFSYSSLGFQYLQRAIEARTGEPLETTVRRLVLEPLGMESSSLLWQERFAGRSAMPHEDGERKELHRPAAANASYSLQTTAGDYGAFVAAMLRGSRLREATWREWLAAAVMVPAGAIVQLDAAPAATEADVGWGLGWGVEPSARTFFQWGKMTGVRAFVMGSPGMGRGVVLLTNSNRGLRVMGDLVGQVMPGRHAAVRWLEQGVTE